MQRKCGWSSAGREESAGQGRVWRTERVEERRAPREWFTDLTRRPRRRCANYQRQHKERWTSGLCNSTPPWVDCPGVGAHDIIAASRRFPRTQPCSPGPSSLHDQTRLPLSRSGVSGRDAVGCRKGIIYIRYLRLSTSFNVDSLGGASSLHSFKLRFTQARHDRARHTANNSRFQTFSQITKTPSSRLQRP